MTGAKRNEDNSDQARYQDPAAPVAERVEDLLSRMTLAEKIGQMTLVEKNSITPAEVTQYAIGGILSGGGGYPKDNSPSGWLRMVNSFKDAALQTRLAIPLIYGVDAVHGHNNMRGAVIFPHNIGLGAARDPRLVQRIARATAVEMAATGTRWDYAPTVAIPQDLRWGRTFEGFGEDAELVTALGTAYVRGLQGDDLTHPLSVLATPKHYVGDGATTWGTSKMVFGPVSASNIFEPTPFIIDQGDARMDEATLREVYLRPYASAVQAGALTIMASFSSWNGQKMHAHHYLLTEVLKGELGFDGFIVSDWAGMDQVADDYYEAMVLSVNAGMDMNMVPMKYRRFLEVMQRAVDSGDISRERLDDAVGRILSVKLRAGLFEYPRGADSYLHLPGAQAHRDLAREAVAKSLVLLKNKDGVLPLSKSLPSLRVAGKWADDIGLQCGGWTIKWLGESGPITPGTSILEALRAAVSSETDVDYRVDGDFEGEPAGTGLVVLGEQPYAEGFGDQADLTLRAEDIALLERVRRHCEKLIVLIVSGRPLILTAQLPLMDALVAVWLPGTAGQGVADVLFGEQPFTGKLSYTWPRSMEQIPRRPEAGQEPLFPYGFGLSTTS